MLATAVMGNACFVQELIARDFN